MEETGNNGELYIKGTIDSSDVIKGAEEYMGALNNMQQTTERAVNAMSDGFQFLTSKIREFGETTNGDIIQKLQQLASEAEKAGGKLLGGNPLSIDLSSPQAQLEAFDAELQKLSANLSNYFDNLAEKLNAITSMLGDRKTVMDSTPVTDQNIEQLENYKQKNAELIGEIQRLKSELDEQKKSWQGVSDTISNQATQAVGQFKGTLDKTSLKNEKKSLEETIGFDESEISKMNAELEAISNQFDVLREKRAELAASPTQNDPLAQGQKNYALNQIDEQVAALQQKEEGLVRLQQEYTAEVSSSKSRLEEVNTQLSQSSQHTVRFRTQIMNSREELIKMALSGKMNTAEFAQTAEKAGMLRRQMTLANAAMNFYADPHRHLTALKTAFQGASGAAGIFVGVTGLMNDKSEKFAEIQAKAMAIMSLTMGVEQAWAMFSAKSFLILEARNLMIKAETASLNINTAAKAANRDLTIAETIAQAALNAVAKANPYLLLAGAIITVIGAIAMWLHHTNAQKKAQEEANNKLKESIEMQKKYSDAVAQNASKAIVNYELLKEKYEQLGNSMNEKNKFISDNQNAFNELGISIKNVQEAENLLEGKTDSFINALMKRAEAAAAVSVAESEMEKALQIENMAKNGKVATGFRSVSLEEYSKAKKNGEKVSVKDFGMGGKQYFVEDKEKTKQNIAKYWDGINKSTKSHRDTAQKMIERSVKDSLQAKDILKQGGISESTGKVGKTKTIKDTTRKDTEEYQEALDKQKYELAKAYTELRRDVAKSEIDAMKEGNEKRRAEVIAEYEDELVQIEEKKNAFLKKKQDLARQEFEKNPSNKGKTFDSSSVSLTADEMGQYYTMMENAEIKHSNSMKEIEDERADSINDYLKEYGTTEEKRLAITNEYNRKIENAGDNEGLKKTLEKQKEEALKTLNFETIKKDINWENVFGELASSSMTSLKLLKSELESVLKNEKEISPENAKVLVEKLREVNRLIAQSEPMSNIIGSYKEAREARKELEDYEKQIEKINQLKVQTSSGEKQLGEAYISSIANLDDKTKKELENYNVTVKMKDANGTITEQVITYGESLKNLGNLQTKATDKSSNFMSKLQSTGFNMGSGSIWGAIGNKVGTGNIGGGAGAIGMVDMTIQGVHKNITGLNDALKDWNLQDTKFGKKMNQLGQLDTYVFGAWEKLKTGNVIGAISDTINGLGKLGDLFKTDTIAEYNEMVKKYSSLISVWDELIQRKKEYINQSYGSEIFKTEDEIKKLYQETINTNKTLGLKLLNSGQSTFARSVGVSQRRNIDSEAWSQLSSWASKENISASTYNSVSSGRMEGLFKLPAEQLEKLQSDAPLFWAELNEDIRIYLENIIKANKALQDSLDTAKEKLLGVSFDSFLSNWESMLEDMSSDNETFSNNFSKQLMKSIVSSQVVAKYKTQMKNIYDTWYSNSMSDNKISENEYEALKAQYMAITEKAKEEVSVLRDTFGWTEDNTSSSGSKNTVSASSEQMNEANGRMTAIEELLVEQNSQQKIDSSSLLVIQNNVIMQTGAISEIRDIQQNTASILSDIRTNTNELYGIHEDLSDIRKRVKDGL